MTMEKLPDCKYCQVGLETHWYFVTGDYKILECPECHDPILIWNSHELPDEISKGHAIHKLLEMFPSKQLEKKENLDEHWYIHVE